MSAPQFQVKLGGRWKAYGDEENNILKRAFMAGFPHAKFELRGSHYKYDFKKMEQTNLDSGKDRNIRPPWKWKQPSKPVCTPGPTMSIVVPRGSPGTTIGIPHPKDKSRMIAVNVPATAKAGMSMMVPVPEDPNGPGTFAADDAPADKVKQGKNPKTGMATGSKVALGIGGAVVVGGAAVGGGLLAMHMAEHGVDAGVDMLADGAGDAGDAIVDGAEGAVDFLADGVGEIGDFMDPALDGLGDGLGDAAGDAGDFFCDIGDGAGDFIMDLF